MKTVLIAGGTGLIGSRMVDIFSENGYAVRIFSRSPEGEQQYQWDPKHGTYDPRAFEGVDCLINLTGAGIADGRWTRRRKQLIRDSRVDASSTLAKALQETGVRPSVYVGASAVGFYGNTGDEWNKEDDPVGATGFMPPVCAEWEKSHRAVEALGIRTVILRIGIVLSKDGGALPEIARPLRFGLGAYFGNGKAWYSWVHIDDVVNMFLHAMRTADLRGVYNAVSPDPVRIIDLVRATAKAMRVWALFVPAPEFALRLMLGEMADVVVNSNRVSAEKISQSGFQYRYPSLEDALNAIYASS